MALWLVGQSARIVIAIAAGRTPKGNGRVRVSVHEMMTMQHVPFNILLSLFLVFILGLSASSLAAGPPREDPRHDVEKVSPVAAGEPIADGAKSKKANARAAPDRSALAQWRARNPGAKQAWRILKAFEAENREQKSAASAIAAARAAYWLGLQLEDEGARETRRLKSFETCRDRARAASKRRAKEAGGYFWEAVCRAKLAELSGIVSSAWQLPDLKALMEKVDKLEPGYANGGTGRYWGTVITRTPGFLRSMQGSSLKEGREYFATSLRQSPNFLGTWMHVAELEKERDDDSAARRAYDKVLNGKKAKDADVEAWNRYYRMKARSARKAL